jgi:hypothetical protein
VDRIVVAGALANKAGKGGEAWVRLSWVLGFQRLGFEVLFVEQIAPSQATPGACRYFEEVVGRFDFSAALVTDDGDAVLRLPGKDLVELAADAQLLVNISGNLTFEPLLEAARCRVFVDLDPGFTQLWHIAGEPGARLEGHDLYFTVGENIGTSVCPIPLDGIPWRPIRQPVVLPQWPVSPVKDRDRFTTVATWRGPYGPVEFGDKRYGLKVHEFRKFVELPQRTRQTFELALDIDPAERSDLDLLRRCGWQLVEPDRVARDPDGFRRYVQGSGAEFSVAQGIYVETASGWFSDRSARYLASGKPVLVQDTGFDRHLPVGEGLISFRTVAEAVAGTERIASDYERHARAARSLAEEYFDSDRVLGRMLEEVGIAP